MTETRRKSKPESLPIIHFYEEFVSKSSTKQGTKVRNATLQQHIRPRSRSSDRSNIKVVKSLSTETTRSTTTVHEQGPTADTPTRRGKKTTNGASATGRTRGREKPKRLTLYERSQLRLKEKEKKIQSIREEMMRECTFKPNANKRKSTISRNSKLTKATISSSRRNSIISTPAGNTEATTPTTASSTRQYWQDLQRIHVHQQVSIPSTASRDGSKTVSTTKSLRFEELYRDGVRRARQRPATEKVSVIGERGY